MTGPALSAPTRVPPSRGAPGGKPASWAWPHALPSVPLSAGGWGGEAHVNWQAFLVSVVVLPASAFVFEFLLSRPRHMRHAPCGYQFAREWIALWLWAGMLWVVIFAVARIWSADLGYALSAAIAAVVQWWRRRRKRRALAALGAKGKALIAAMVAAMRERAQPRPVLRPGLQAAR
jgi:hypothetical protein